MTAVPVARKSITFTGTRTRGTPLSVRHSSISRHVIQHVTRKTVWLDLYLRQRPFINRWPTMNYDRCKLKNSKKLELWALWIKNLGSNVHSILFYFHEGCFVYFAFYTEPFSPVAGSKWSIFCSCCLNHPDTAKSFRRELKTSSMVRIHENSGVSHLPTVNRSSCMIKTTVKPQFYGHPQGKVFVVDNR